MIQNVNCAGSNRKNQQSFVKTSHTQRRSGRISKNGSLIETERIEHNQITSLVLVECRRKVDKNQRRNFEGILIYCWWNVWEERNRRTFQQKSLNPRQVAGLCKDDIRTEWQWQHYKKQRACSSLVEVLLPSFRQSCLVVWTQAVQL